MNDVGIRTFKMKVSQRVGKGGRTVTIALLAVTLIGGSFSVKTILLQSLNSSSCFIAWTCSIIVGSRILFFLSPVFVPLHYLHWCCSWFTPDLGLLSFDLVVNQGEEEWLIAFQSTSGENWTVKRLLNKSNNRKLSFLPAYNSTHKNSSVIVRGCSST